MGVERVFVIKKIDSEASCGETMVELDVPEDEENKEAAGEGDGKHMDERKDKGKRQDERKEKGKGNQKGQCKQKQHQESNENDKDTTTMTAAELMAGFVVAAGVQKDCCLRSMIVVASINERCLIRLIVSSVIAVAIDG